MPSEDQPVLGQFAAFKKWKILSTKDYVIIYCLAILWLGLFAATSYMNPLDFFHVISKEHFQAMREQNFQKIIRESLNRPFENNPMIALLREAGWNSVWAFLCLLPQFIFVLLFVLFPFFFVFNAIIKQHVKAMMQLWKIWPEQK